MVLLVKGFGNKCTCGLEGKGPKIVGGTPAEVFKMQYKNLYSSNTEVKI
jgi:hypothetical protein